MRPIGGHPKVRGETDCPAKLDATCVSIAAKFNSAWARLATKLLSETDACSKAGKKSWERAVPLFFEKLKEWRFVLALSSAVILNAEAARAQISSETPDFYRVTTPSLSFYGSTGLIDMPTAEHQPDAQFSSSVSYFGGQSRFNLTFQAFPWLSATFRYSGIEDLNLFGFDTYYDRGFDVRFRLLEETDVLPAVTLGFQDFVGTGIFSAEYLVATKGFDVPGWGSPLPGRLKVTGGLGWGRLGSNNSIGSPFGEERPEFDGGTGGELATDSWFRGPMSPFAGIEYLPNDRLGFKLEYSSDAYETETQDSNVFERRSSINAGVEYKIAKGTRVGAYYLYGSELGVSLQLQLNPKEQITPFRIAAPQSVQQRLSRSSNPTAWSTSWTQSTTAPVQIRDRLAPVLRADGLLLEYLTVAATSAEVRFRNIRYESVANAVGRVARAMAAILPPSVETFRIVPTSNGMAVSAVTVRRSDLERLEFSPNAPAAIEAVVGYSDAPELSSTAVLNEELYPSFGWSLGPYISQSYFDPDAPIRVDVGIEGSAIYRPAPGWLVSGAVRGRIAGNIADGRPSNSVLPRVLSDAVLYAQESVTLENLYASRQWRPGQDLYARATVGYLVAMYGGISGELLWKPVSSPLALGVEMNYAVQRDFDQRFGFQDYEVFTGHASAYYEFGEGYIGQIDVGRYLAGDDGATFQLTRTFANGWEFGGFFTLTDVSAEDFGEGSFDKGILLRIPLGEFIGRPSRRGANVVIRPVQRDGGAKLIVPNRLYRQVQEGHRAELRGQAARFWE